MRANDIARALSSQAEAVVRLLLPKGKRQGHEWRVGGTSGEPGESLGVHLVGEKSGVWADFASGESGDLIGLWMAVKGLDLRDACKEAMDYLGIREDRIDPPRKSYSKPTREGVHRLDEAHRAWLEGERKIAPATIATYRLASKDGAIMFPYLRDGELIAAKYRKLPKQFHQDAGCEPSLFGWQAVPDDARSVLICEGEMDALAWHSYGIPALSVPMGGGTGAKHSWIEAEFERLSLLDTVFVSMDSDEAGQAAVRDICERLGRERCRVVTLPHKDANDCLVAGVPTDEMMRALRDSRTMDPSELRDIGDFEDAIVAEYTRIDHGILLPWKKTQERLKLREGETSIWSGYNGHGKSTLLSQVAGVAALEQARVCVASMEYRTALWMMRMNRQLSGVVKPTEEFSRHITRALKGRMFAFDVNGKSKAQRILEVFRYARRRYDIGLFVLDNLTKCGFADDDYPGQKAFVEELSDFARTEETHVAIVAHMKKGESEDRPAGKMGVKGSGGITDMADTVVEVWRNKPRERAIADAREAALQVRSTDWRQFVVEKYRDAPDCLAIVSKQRMTGEEPTFSFWYDQQSTQFLAKESHRPRPYVGFSAVQGVA
jgi:twinkle protein